MFVSSLSSRSPAVTPNPPRVVTLAFGGETSHQCRKFGESPLSPPLKPHRVCHSDLPFGTRHLRSLSDVPRPARRIEPPSPAQAMPVPPPGYRRRRSLKEFMEKRSPPLAESDEDTLLEQRPRPAKDGAVTLEVLGRRRVPPSPSSPTLLMVPCSQRSALQRERSLTPSTDSPLQLAASSAALSIARRTQSLPGVSLRTLLKSHAHTSHETLDAAGLSDVPHVRPRRNSVKKLVKKVFSHGSHGSDCSSKSAEDVYSTVEHSSATPAPVPMSRQTSDPRERLDKSRSARAPPPRLRLNVDNHLRLLPPRVFGQPSPRLDTDSEEETRTPAGSRSAVCATASCIDLKEQFPDVAALSRRRSFSDSAHTRSRSQSRSAPGETTRVRCKGNPLTPAPNGDRRSKADVPSLDAVLDNPSMCRHFEAFLKTVYCEENLQFIVASRRLERMTDLEEANQHISMLWARFLSHKANQQVNISHGCFQAIQHQLFPALYRKRGLKKVSSSESQSLRSSKPLNRTSSSNDLKSLPTKAPQISLSKSKSNELVLQEREEKGCASECASHGEHRSSAPVRQLSHQVRLARYRQQFVLSPLRSKPELLAFQALLQSACREVATLINGNLLTRFSESRYYQQFFVDECRSNMRKARTPDKGKGKDKRRLSFARRRRDNRPSHASSHAASKGRRRFSLF